MRYYYICLDSDQNKIEGTIDSKNKNSAIIELTKEDLLPLVIKLDILNFKKKEKLIKNKDISFISSQFAYIIESGIDVQTGLNIILEQSTGIVHDKFNYIKNSLEEGNTFYNSFDNAGGFPKFYLQLLSVGEKTDTIEFMFNKLSTYYTEKDVTKNKLFNSLIYPLVVMTFMLVAIISSIIFVMPNYMSVFETLDVELPLITKIFILITNFISTFFIPIIIFLLIVILKINSSYKKNPLKYYKSILKLPLIGSYIIKEFNYYFADTFSLLLQTGITVPESIENIAYTINNLAIKNSLLDLHNNIINGIELEECFEETTIFEPMLFTSLTVGIETGKLEESMYKATIYYKNELLTISKRNEKIFEVLITVVLGLLLGFIMLSMLLPTFYLSGGI